MTEKIGKQMAETLIRIDEVNDRIKNSSHIPYVNVISISENIRETFQATMTAYEKRPHDAYLMVGIALAGTIRKLLEYVDSEANKLPEERNPNLMWLPKSEL